MRLVRSTSGRDGRERLTAGRRRPVISLWRAADAGSRARLRSRGVSRRPPPVAGRYVLLEEIGRGGHGVVHRALDLRTRRHVAAKVLRGGDPEALLRFVREQAHRIEHPHVLAPLGWAAEDDVALIAMELVLRRVGARPARGRRPAAGGRRRAAARPAPRRARRRPRAAASSTAT